MPVQMDRVRHRRAILDILDDPVGPDVGDGQLDQVFGDRVVSVAFLDIGEDGFLPVDVDGREVYAPVDDVLIVGGDGGAILAVDVEGPRLAGEEVLGHGVGDPWHKGSGFYAVVGLHEGGAGGITVWCALVVEDGGFAAVHGVGIAAAAPVFRQRAEPVVADVLLGFDDDVMALADTEKYPISCDGVDGNEVGGYYGHFVAVQRNPDLVVHGRVNQS